MESSRRVWAKVIVFYLLTLAFSSIFYVFILSTGLRGGGLYYVTGLMWCPAFAALATKTLFRESIRNMGWQWGKSRYQLLSYFIPIGYALPVYLVVWLTGLGGFYHADFVNKTAATFGWTGLSPALVILGYIALTALIGIIISLSRALGEEIGWRGFLVPELIKVTSFRGTALISGLMWAAWHYPILLFGDYNAGTPAWYGLSCFTVMVVASSFIAAWLRLRSGSLWTAAILHASHNLFIQGVFTPLTADTGKTKYVIDEFGVGLAVTTVVAAIIVSCLPLKRDDQPTVHA
jgi:membrane protease YdiL (CAAX protease family)